MKIGLIENYPGLAKPLGWWVKSAGEAYSLDLAEPEIIEIHKDIPYPADHDFDAYVLSGGIQGVYEKEKYPFINPSIDYVRDLVENDARILGVCYGHQLLAEAMGGEVIRTTSRETGFKLINVEVKNDPLFEGRENNFYSSEFHIDQIVKLPDGAKILASSENCPVEAFRYRNQKVWGIQFHPEFTPRVLEKIYAGEKENLEAGGYSVDGLNNEANEKYDEEASLRLMYNFLTA